MADTGHTGKSNVHLSVLLVTHSGAEMHCPVPDPATAAAKIWFLAPPVAELGLDKSNNASPANWVSTEEGKVPAALLSCSTMDSIIKVGAALSSLLRVGRAESTKTTAPVQCPLSRRRP